MLEFGFYWKTISPYCGSFVPVEMWVFRIAMLMPFLVTEVLALLSFSLYPSKWTAGLVGYAIGVCVHDLWVVIKMRRFDKHFLVAGHPSDEWGYEIFARP
jgi:hypothetical protein